MGPSITGEALKETAGKRAYLAGGRRSLALVTCLTLAACGPTQFSVGGTVSGLEGEGLVLRSSLGDVLVVSEDGPFTFPTRAPTWTPFTVSIARQPTAPWQTCAITNGKGTLRAVDVNSVVVNCAHNRYLVSGTIDGLYGHGLVLGSPNLPILPLQPGESAFAFQSPVSSGTRYEVTVVSQPANPSQTCEVANGHGTISNASVASVAVRCATSGFPVGGTVVGLVGEGLVLGSPSLPALTISSDTTRFDFASPVESGSVYDVTVVNQPTNPSQTCRVSNGTGNVGDESVESVRIDCETNAYQVRGSISGLLGSGLVLASGADALPILADGTFAFPAPVPSGQSYSIAVRAQPTSPSQTCTVLAASGIVGGADVADVVVSCRMDSFAVGGQVSGLAGLGLVLRISESTGFAVDLPVAASGSFAASVMSGASYSVTVLTQPTSPSQTCTVSNGSGTVGASDVTGLAVACTTNTYRIRGTVTGLSGSGLMLRNNGGDNLGITANGSFAFAASVLSGGSYSITVLTQPTSPSQTCTVLAASGIVGGADVADVVVSCRMDSFAVGGQVSGLAGLGLVVRISDSTGSAVDRPVAASGSFAVSVLSGASYSVTVLAQPTGPAQTCRVSNGSGTVGASDVTGVTVACPTNTYRIRGNVTGLSGSGLVLRNNGGDNLSVTANGSFAFAASVLSGASYSVTVLTQPTGPAQTCTVSNGSGTVGASDVTSATVACTTSTYRIRGTVAGLSGSGLVLRNNGGDALGIAANGSFAFAGSVMSGASFSVTVLTQPTSSSQTCRVSNGSGTVGSGDVTSVTVACTTNAFRIRGTVAGLSGSGLVLRNNGGDNLSIAANGPVAFANSVLSGASYSVTVLTQPTGPAQTCTVSKSSGIVSSGDVTNVAVACGSQPLVIVGPHTASVEALQPLQLDVTVSGLASAAVSWRIQEGAEGGSVSAGGLYRASALTGTFHVIATSVADPTVSDVATITVPAPAPMRLLSRGVPAFASSGTASLANDASYGTEWVGTGSTSWLAFDLAGAGALGPALVAWYTNDTFGYDQTSNSQTDAMPGDYSIEVHSDTGSGSPPASGWVTLVTVSGNRYTNRQHSVDLSGQRWIRFSGAPSSTNLSSNIKLNLDVFDARGGFTDSWIFVGDSNTAYYMVHQELGDQNFSQQIAASAPSNFPAFLNCGIVGLFAVNQGLLEVEKALAAYPQARYVAVVLGGNDSSQGLPSNYQFYDAYRSMVDAVLAAGRVPVVPRTVIWHGMPTAYRAISDPSPYSLNNQLTRLLSDYAGRVVPGPDLWTVFENAPKNAAGQPLDPAGHPYFDTDLVHAGTTWGIVLTRILWADAVAARMY